MVVKDKRGTKDVEQHSQSVTPDTLVKPLYKEFVLFGLHPYFYSYDVDLDVGDSYVEMCLDYARGRTFDDNLYREMSDFVYRLVTELANECLDPVSPEHDTRIALTWGGDKKRPFILVDLPVSGIKRVAKVLSRVRMRFTFASGTHGCVANSSHSSSPHERILSATNRSATLCSPQVPRVVSVGALANSTGILGSSSPKMHVQNGGSPSASSHISPSV